MPRFGKASQRHLNTCHPDIQKVLEQAIINGPDFAVTCGKRGKAAQARAVKCGLSQVNYPNSRHNVVPPAVHSTAVDLAPYPIDWNDTARFHVLAGYILGVADGMGIQLRWGGDWDIDYDLSDQRFIDLPHFELVR